LTDRNLKTNDMGLFDLFKRNDQVEDQSSSRLKKVIVDDVYIIEIPENWTQFKSDKFRTVSKSKKINFVATNTGKQLVPNNKFSIEELKEETFALFERFVKEGGYEAIDDREVGQDFVYQSFKVDSETQYYYYTSREGQGILIRIYFILKEVGDYSVETKNLLLNIGRSIMTKIA
jgi:hypothetical protein